MFKPRAICFAGTLAGFLLALSAPGAAIAGPLSVVSGAALSPSVSTDISDARYRRPVRRRAGPGPDAVIGLFGAVLGGVIANQRYDNYSNYSYGRPYDYGYAPGYAAGPVYRGGGAHPGGRFNRGGGFGRGGGGAKGGGGAHSGKR